MSLFEEADLFPYPCEHPLSIQSNSVGDESELFSFLWLRLSYLTELFTHLCERSLRSLLPRRGKNKGMCLNFLLLLALLSHSAFFMITLIPICLNFLRTSSQEDLTLLSLEEKCSSVCGLLLSSCCAHSNLIKR